MQWLQDSRKINGDNLNNIRREASRQFRNKRREYLKDAMNSTNVRDLYRGINEFKKSNSKLSYDRWPVGQSILVSGLHLGPAANFSFTSLEIISTFAAFSIWCALSEERVGL
jgi:hypothetical protein